MTQKKWIIRELNGSCLLYEEKNGEEVFVRGTTIKAVLNFLEMYYNQEFPDEVVL